MTFSPEILSGAVEETRNSSQAMLDDDGVKRPDEMQPPHVDGSREAGPSTSRLRRVRARRTRGGRGEQARQHQRR